MRFGVIGLGAIGRAVAANLVGAGFPTTVWNQSPAPVADLVERGAIGAGDVGEAFRNDVVLSVLFDDAAVRDVFLSGGILATARAGTVHVCLSTISTAIARDMVRVHGEHGVGYVGAPVFGRPDAAVDGQLQIVTAGPPELLDRVEPILKVLGRTWRMGDDPQIGHLAKIAGNFLIGCASEAMMESAALIASHGGDPSPFLAMMSETLLAAPIYRALGPGFAAGTPRHPDRLRIALKDNALALAEAAAADTCLPFADVVRNRLKREGAERSRPTA